MSDEPKPDVYVHIRQYIGDYRQCSMTGCECEARYVLTVLVAEGGISYDDRIPSLLCHGHSRNFNSHGNSTIARKVENTNENMCQFAKRIERLVRNADRS